jgi:hypothetical protein
MVLLLASNSIFISVKTLVSLIKLCIVKRRPIGCYNHLGTIYSFGIYGTFFGNTCWVDGIKFFQFLYLTGAANDAVEVKVKAKASNKLTRIFFLSL